MNMNGVLHELSQERKRMENQLGALRAAELEIKRLVDSRNGHPVKASLRVQASHSNSSRPPMSNSARARIAAAQRARWAKWHKLQGR